MKLLLIPDVHGRHFWKEPVKEAIKSKDVHIIFLGDYVDSFNVEGYKILQNLRDIIAFKKKFPNKVTLLLGNHDYAYIHNFFQITGFNSAMMYDYKKLFEKYKDLFQLAWGYQGTHRYTLVTHAGLTQGFYDILLKKAKNKKEHIHLFLSDLVNDKYSSIYKIPIHDFLNYFKDQTDIMWNVSHYRGGAHQYGSFIWADKRELDAYNIKGIDQIIGHTNLSNITIKKIDEDTLYFIDASNYNSLSFFSITLL